MSKGKIVYSDILVGLWMVGISILGIYFASSYFAFMSGCKKQIQPIKDESLTRQVYALKQKYLGKVKLTVCQSKKVSSPMLIGIFRPYLILPINRKSWEEKELEMIMIHEFYHYKKKDIWLKLFMMIVCCINWFNPFVFLMKKQFFYDLELACDDNVLSERRIEEREKYARIMLSFAGNREENTSFSTGFFENNKKMKKRIDYMLDTKNKKKGMFGFGVVGLFVIAMCLIVSCGYKPEEEKNTNVDGQVDTQPIDAEQLKEEKLSTPFDYNNAHNRIVRCYGNDNTYISRENGIYCVREGVEELIFENTYGLRRGMDIYKDYLYFCGATIRGEEEAATIYRMNLQTQKVEDALALFSQKFEVLYNVSIYEDKLYVANDYGAKIGFELNDNGEIGEALDDTADDFLYREFNEYNDLQQKQWDPEIDAVDYENIVEELQQKYCPIIEAASCQKMLKGNQVVSKAKDEMYRSLYLEDAQGSYEYLCDYVGYPVLVTETGVYYAAEDRGSIWFVDYENKTKQQIYEPNPRELITAYLVNYDENYIYFVTSRRLGAKGEVSISEEFLNRIPRQGGKVEKVYQFEEGFNINGLYSQCGIDSTYMYFENHERINLNPDSNGMEKVNSGELSEDALELTKLVDTFIQAYLDGNEETLRLLVTEDFEGELDVYPEGEEIEGIEEKYTSGIPEGQVAVGVCCYISCELSGVGGEDSLSYMTMEVLKTEQGWKVEFYGLEK